MICGCFKKVKLLGNESGDRVLQRVYIKLRINVCALGCGFVLCGFKVASALFREILS